MNTYIVRFISARTEYTVTLIGASEEQVRQWCESAMSEFMPIKLEIILVSSYVKRSWLRRFIHG
jgi:hypothetical protein